MNTATTSQDIPLQLLIQHAQQTGPGLWLLDENCQTDRLSSILPHCQIAITNRYHLYHKLNSQHNQIYFNDFDFSCCRESTISRIYYRVSKEKALCHYLINQAYQILPENGQLHLSGYKDEGIKTYLKKADKLFGETRQLLNGEKTAKYATLQKTRTDNQPLLDDKHYQQLQEIARLHELPVVSKPGVFGWNKADTGSQFLIGHLPALLTSTQTQIQQVLDLGCGYGFIALHAYHNNPQLQSAHFTLTDNNAAAISCARANLDTHQIPGEVSGDDCGNQLPGNHYDLILCNPPFHQGFDVTQDITGQFVKSAHRLLAPNGKVLFVVNQFVGLEKIASRYFRQLDIFARNQSFKLILAADPARDR